MLLIRLLYQGSLAALSDFAWLFSPHSFGVKKKPMQQFQGEKLMNLSGVVSPFLDVAIQEGFHSLRL